MGHSGSFFICFLVQTIFFENRDCCSGLSFSLLNIHDLRSNPGEVIIFSKSIAFKARKRDLGNGWGSFDSAVASDTRGPRFESNHWQKFKMNIFTVNYSKDKNKEKEAENGPLKMT